MLHDTVEIINYIHVKAEILWLIHGLEEEPSLTDVTPYINVTLKYLSLLGLFCVCF